jgi:hypothetical protein
VIPNSWKIFDPSSTDKNNGVFLEVVANTWDIGSYFDAVG